MSPPARGHDGGVHVRLDVGLGQRPVVDADLVDQPGEVLAVGGVAADPERVVGGLDGAGGRAGGGLGAVDEQPLGGAVVGQCHVGPGVDGTGGRTAHVCGAGPEGPAARWAQRSVAVAGVEEVGVGLALHDRSPAALADRRSDPGREGHRRGQVQRGRVRDPDHAVRAIEAQGVAVAAQGRPGRAGQGSRVAPAGGVGGGGAGSLAEPPGPDQARRRGRGVGGGGLGGSGISAEVAGGVDRPHLVAVGGRGARVRCRRRRSPWACRPGRSWCSRLPGSARPGSR